MRSHVDDLCSVIALKWKACPIPNLDQMGENRPERKGFRDNEVRGNSSKDVFCCRDIGTAFVSSSSLRLKIQVGRQCGITHGNHTIYAWMT